jgi:hypothetical protein
MLPEERELARLEAEQAELKEQVTSAELELETIKTETARFQYVITRRWAVCTCSWMN